MLKLIHFAARNQTRLQLLAIWRWCFLVIIWRRVRILVHYMQTAVFVLGTARYYYLEAARFVSRLLGRDEFSETDREIGERVEHATNFRIDDAAFGSRCRWKARNWKYPQKSTSCSFWHSIDVNRNCIQYFTRERKQDECFERYLFQYGVKIAIQLNMYAL